VDPALQPLEKEFLGYDCSTPRNLAPVRPRQAAACSEKADPGRQRNVTYTVLQKANYNRASGFRCRVWRSTVVHYCGVYHHQTFVPALSSFGVQETVSQSDCRNMWDSEFFTSGSARWAIRRNDKVSFAYESKGWTLWDGTQFTCTGESEDSGDPGDPYTRTMKAYFLTVQMEEIDLLINEDDEVTVDDTQKVLPCRYGEQGCDQSDAAYFWTTMPHKDRCAYYKVRTTTGILVAGNGKETYISRDDTMIRMVVGRKRHECGHEVIETNYPKVFLTTAVTAPAFIRPLHLSEYSVLAYSNAKDSYLHGELTEAIKEEFNRILRKDCLDVLRRRGNAFATRAAEQRSVMDGDTTALGPGIFATAAGETWYRYACDQVSVIAIELPTCFAALPIQMSSNDMNQYRRALNITAESPQLFLEPHSHRITDTLLTHVQERPRTMDQVRSDSRPHQRTRVRRRQRQPGRRRRHHPPSQALD
jgi:hypothetical protein